MFYYFFLPHIESFNFLNLFKYITFRAGGALFTALIISFIINIFQYFDIRIMEEEIRASALSYLLMDFAPKTLSVFVDFFPSLEVIVENGDSLKKIDV